MPVQKLNMQPAIADTQALERVRQYWNRRPCNIRHSPKPVGTYEYFQEVRNRKYLVEPHIRDFAQFPFWRGKRVLEVGCGIGSDTMEFALNGASVTAVDLSEESLKVARRRAVVYGVADRVRFLNANAEELSDALEVEPYDLVYSFGVLHHTPHPERAIEQIRRFMRPGGTFKLMVYHRTSWKVLHILMTYGRGRVWRLNELVARHSEAETGCPVTYSYTRNSGRKLLEQAGFHVTGVEVDHIFPYRIPDYVNYRYVRVWYFRPLPPPIFHWMERHFGWHLCMTATV